MVKEGGMDRRLKFLHDPVQQGRFSCSWLTDEGNKALAFTDAIEQASIHFFMSRSGIKKSRVRSEVERLLTQAEVGGIHCFSSFSWAPLSPPRGSAQSRSPPLAATWY